MEKEIKCNITGRVQLVMFRDFAKRQADKLDLFGFVKNLEDGSVEVLAQGEKENLDKYVGLLKKGPIFARVDDIDVIWGKPVEQFNSFKIVY